MTKPTSSPDPKNGAPLQRQTLLVRFDIVVFNNEEMRRHVKQAKQPTSQGLSRHPPPFALIQFCCTRKSFVPICMFAVDPFALV